MKKLISVLMGIVLFASISCLSVYASDYTLEVENGEIDDYENITATIIISENSGIYSGEFNFLYNSSYFELGEIELNQSGTNGKIETQTDTENGVVTFTYKANDEAGCTFGGEFATLNMRLVSTPESVVSFNLDMASTTDYEGNELEATYKITPIEVPISFIVTETQAQTEQTESAEATTQSSEGEEKSGDFLSALWTVIKVILIIIIVIVVLLIVASFFTRRYFKKKRQRQRQAMRNAQNRQ
ncbi:MAG: cohesin domain-containing protein [Ruminococcus sp.]|nr:cohesin domain-containing protein [Ruminococcus sp.]